MLTDAIKRARHLALLPFAILNLLIVNHPDAMAWLWEGWRLSPTPRIRLFGFDAMIMLMLALGSTFGARTMSRLRRQVPGLQLGRIGGDYVREIVLADVTIRDQQGRKAIHADRGVVRFAFWPLLHRRLVVSALVID